MLKFRLVTLLFSLTFKEVVLQNISTGENPKQAPNQSSTSNIYPNGDLNQHQSTGHATSNHTVGTESDTSTSHSSSHHLNSSEMGSIYPMTASTSQKPSSTPSMIYPNGEGPGHVYPPGAMTTNPTGGKNSDTSSHPTNSNHPSAKELGSIYPMTTGSTTKSTSINMKIYPSRTNAPISIYPPRTNASISIYPPRTNAPTSIYPPKTNAPTSIYPPRTNAPTSIYPPRTNAPTSIYPPRTNAPASIYPPRTNAPTLIYPRTNAQTSIYPQRTTPTSSTITPSTRSTIRPVIQGGNEVPFCAGTGLDCYRCSQCWPGGWCVKDGREPRCVCVYGWTGGNSMYQQISSKRNLVRADSCIIPCHYTPFVRNPNCAQNSPLVQRNTAIPTNTNSNLTKRPTTSATTTSYRNQARADNTGSPAYYSSALPATTKITTTQATVRTTKTYSPDDTVHNQIDPENPLTCAGLGLKCVRCNDICGAGGWCIMRNDGKNIRCLCYYGWTGPNAVFSRKGTFIALTRNRIEADHCKTKCHYTPYVRNTTCAEEPRNIATTQRITTTSSTTASPQPPPPSAITATRPTTTSTSSTNSRSYQGDNRRGLTYRRNRGYQNLYTTDTMAITATKTTATTMKTSPKSSTESTTPAKTRSYFLRRGFAYRGTRNYTTDTTTTKLVPSTTLQTSRPRSLGHRGLSYRENNDKSYRSFQMNNPTNPSACRAVGLDCVHCEVCGAGGWCVTDNSDVNLQCLCSYGFTGDNAQYIPERSDFTYFLFTKNRIRANDCKTHCHYTHTHRNPHCVRRR